tara:strand:+ start:151 stop:687 length:537 start_codon:yes stop_codon:yes gene_type:complete
MEIKWLVEAHSGIVAHNNERIQYIPNYPGYFVGELGNIYSAHQKNFTIDYNKLKKKKAFISDKKRDKPYLMVTLSYNGNPSLLTVHRLVALAFIPNPHRLPVVNHKKYPSNKAIDLEWSTQLDNCNIGDKTKDHLLCDPLGNTITIRNLAKFCRENNLHTASFYNHRKCKGWTYLGSL